MGGSDSTIITMDKGDNVKTICKCMLVDDTHIKETVRARMSEFGFKYGSSRKSYLRGRIQHFYNHWLTETATTTYDIC